MAEFALVAPLLLLLLFGIVDFGRVIYIYVTLNQAVNEGARTAIRASAQLPTNTDVETAVRQDVDLASVQDGDAGKLLSCPRDLFGLLLDAVDRQIARCRRVRRVIGDRDVLVAQEDAPGGQGWAFNTGTCSATNPAHDHAPLQVTIRYNFVPFTPLLQQFTGGALVITAAATYATEY